MLLSQVPASQGISKELEELLHRMLEKKPAERITLQEIKVSIGRA